MAVALAPRILPAGSLSAAGAQAGAAESRVVVRLGRRAFALPPAAAVAHGLMGTAIRSQHRGRRPLQQPRAASDGSDAEADDAPQKTGASDGVEVQFVLVRECHFGQSFFVVGSTPQLGEWDVERALPMQWNEGNVWRGSAVFTPGAVMDFKVVMAGKRGEVEWQQGPNRQSSVPEAAAAELVVEWDHEGGGEELVVITPTVAAVAVNNSSGYIGEAAAVDSSISVSESSIDGESNSSSSSSSSSSSNSSSGGSGSSDRVSSVDEVSPTASALTVPETSEGEEKNGAALAGVASSLSPSPSPIKPRKSKSKRKPAARSFQEVLEKDAMWGKKVWSKLLGSLGRRTLMEEEGAKKADSPDAAVAGAPSQNGAAATADPLAQNTGAEGTAQVSEPSKK